MDLVKLHPEGLRKMVEDHDFEPDSYHQAMEKEHFELADYHDGNIPKIIATRRSPKFLHSLIHSKIREYHRDNWYEVYEMKRLKLQYLAEEFDNWKENVELGKRRMRSMDKKRQLVILYRGAYDDAKGYQVHISKRYGIAVDPPDAYGYKRDRLVIPEASKTTLQAPQPDAPAQVARSLSGTGRWATSRRHDDSSLVPSEPTAWERPRD